MDVYLTKRLFSLVKSVQVSLILATLEVITNLSCLFCNEPCKPNLNKFIHHELWKGEINTEPSIVSTEQSLCKAVAALQPQLGSCAQGER